MGKFIRPNKVALKNAQHYSLMQAFKTVLNDANFTPAKILALIATFLTCFSNEDHWFMQARSSEVIARRDAADKKRDKLYSKLFTLVRLWRDSGNTAFEMAAEALVKLFHLYAVDTKAQIDEESGQLDNLITDLSTAEMQAHIQTIGGKWLFDEMKAAHEEVKSIRLEQGNEESEKVAGALRKARKESDAAYDAILAAIEAFATIADDPAPYEAFITKWNGTLKIYQDIINRKGGSSTAGTANPEGTGTGADTPGTGDNTGDNGGGTGTGTITPSTPDPEPDNGGGGNGGTQPEDDQ